IGDMGAQMSSDLPGDVAFELKLVFIRELDTGYRKAREAYDRLLRTGTDPAALKEMEGFFHRIAGTAHSADLAVLGHSASVCETLAGLAQKGQLSSPAEVVQMLGEGLAAVASTLDAHGSQ